jgi:hypothetical protein
VIATISLGGTWGADVEVDETGVWAAYFGKEHAGVSRIDPTMDAVVADVQLPSGYVRRITVADGSVVATELEWSGNEGSPSEGPCMVLTAIDPVTATIGVREPVDPPCGTVELIEWNGQIWASGASLQRVDPITARLIGEPVAFDLERFPRSFVLAIGNEVWFGAYPGGNGIDRIEWHGWIPPQERSSTSSKPAVSMPLLHRIRGRSGSWSTTALSHGSI